MIFYLFIVKVSNVTLTEYRNINTMGQINFQTLPNQVWQAYGRFFTYFSFNSLFSYPTWFQIMYPIIITVTGILLLYKSTMLIVKRKYPKAIISVGCAVLFPLGVNFIYVMCDPSLVHTLMRYGMVAAFVVIIAIWGDTECIKILGKKWNRKLVGAIKATVMICSILVIGVHETSL